MSERCKRMSKRTASVCIHGCSGSQCNPSPKQGTEPWVSGPYDNNPDPYPHLIWYDFVSRSVSPAKISFLPRRDGKNNNIDKTPTAFQLIASNDEVCSGDSSWTVLCEEKNAPAIDKDNLETLNEERGWF